MAHAKMEVIASGKKWIGFCVRISDDDNFSDLEFDDYQRSCSLAYDVINRVIEVKGWSAPPQKRGLILRFFGQYWLFRCG